MLIIDWSSDVCSSELRRMNTSQPGLDEKFKDVDDPLRIVFVCAMWLTGFDAPSCATLYLDKPMRNHTLMQTIARANRVFPGKHSGLVVDYANVFASLEKALAIYRSEEHTSELQSLMRISYAVFCLNNNIRPTDIISVATNNQHSTHRTY